MNSNPTPTHAAVSDDERLIRLRALEYLRDAQWTVADGDVPTSTLQLAVMVADLMQSAHKKDLI